MLFWEHFPSYNDTPYPPPGIFRLGLLGTVSKIPWSQWSEIFFTSPLTPPPPSQKWNSVLRLASFYDGKHKHEANFFWKKWNSDHEIAYALPPSEKYFTSLASRYFWDGPLPGTKTARSGPHVIRNSQRLCMRHSSGLDRKMLRGPPLEYWGGGGAWKFFGKKYFCRKNGWNK